MIATSLMSLETRTDRFTQLDLRGNHVRDATPLARAIRMSSSLRSVILEWNSLGLFEPGLEVLGDALMDNHSVIELDLRNNRLGPSFVPTLARVIRRNRTLRSIDVRWNDLGPTAGEALREALEHNPTLTRLHLAGNRIPDVHIEEIDKLLRRNLAGLPPSRPPSKDILAFAASAADELEAKREEEIVGDTRRRVEKYYEELQATNARLAQTQEELRGAKLRIRELEERLATTDQALDGAVREQTQLTKEIERERASHAEQLEQAREELVRLDRARADADERRRRADAEARKSELALREELHALRDSVVAAEADRDVARKEAEVAHTAAERIESTLTEEREGAKRRAAAAERAAAEDAARLERDLQTVRRELESERRRAREQHVLHGEQLQRAEEELTTLRSQLSEAQLRATESLSEQERRLSKLWQDRFAAETAATDARIAALDEARKAAEGSALRSEEQRKTDTKANESRTREMQTTIRTLDARAGDLHRDLQHAQEQLASAEADAASAKRESEENAARVAQLETEIERLQRVLRDAEKQHKLEIDRQKDWWQRRIDDADVQTERLRQEVRDLGLKLQEERGVFERKLADAETAVTEAVRRQFRTLSIASATDKA